MKCSRCGVDRFVFMDDYLGPICFSCLENFVDELGDYYLVWATEVEQDVYNTVLDAVNHGADIIELLKRYTKFPDVVDEIGDMMFDKNVPAAVRERLIEYIRSDAFLRDAEVVDK